jgi:hypothetical protein
MKQELSAGCLLEIPHEDIDGPALPRRFIAVLGSASRRNIVRRAFRCVQTVDRSNECVTQQRQRLICVSVSMASWLQDHSFVTMVRSEVQEVGSRYVVPRHQELTVLLV